MVSLLESPHYSRLLSFLRVSEQFQPMVTAPRDESSVAEATYHIAHGEITGV